MSKQTRVAVATLCLGILATMGAFALRADSPHGFTIFYTTTVTPANDVPRHEGDRVRYNKADGSFVETAFTPDGAKRNTLLGIAGRGVFKVNDRTRSQEFMSELPSAPVRMSEAQVRKDPSFNREEVVLGYKTFVMRVEHEDKGSYTEVWRAPSLQGVALKVINVDVSSGTMVIEATKVELGEPPTRAFDVPTYPVSFQHFERKIERVQETSPDAASALREQLSAKKKRQQ